MAQIYAVVLNWSRNEQLDSVWKVWKISDSRGFRAWRQAVWAQCATNYGITIVFEIWKSITN